MIDLLKRSGRGHHPALVEKILAALTAPALRQPERVERAFGQAVARLVGIIVAMQQAVDGLESALNCEFTGQPPASGDSALGP
ncbi:hypothetical protein [Nocardia sp. NPDC059239]|uniref:hypothetical protein n=1 Tax=Nocardia sp. NPDC059239 TaxID=3346785 RepID=UPI003696557D